MTNEQKNELQTIRANDLFHSLTEEERKKVICFMIDILEKKIAKV